MTDLQRGKLLSSRRVYEGRLIKLDEASVQFPSGQTVELELIRHPGAAAIVPVLSELDSPDPQLLLLRQFRYAADSVIWEIPAGILEPDESPEDCARRELKEETGAVASEFRHLTTIYTTPGFTDEQIHLFLATGLTVTETSHEPDELITVDTRPLSQVLEMIRDGEIVDGKTIAGLLYVAGFVMNR